MWNKTEFSINQERVSWRSRAIKRFPYQRCFYLSLFTTNIAHSTAAEELFADTECWRPKVPMHTKP